MKINFDTVDIVEDWYDGDYGSSQVTRTYYVCEVCGSVVKDKVLHESWHNED